MLLHVLVEEPSAEPVIRRVVDAVAPHTDVCFIQFRGKHDLLRKLDQRMRGYSHWATTVDLRVMVLVDRDSDDCHELKVRLESSAQRAGLLTLSGPVPQVATRIACEELEAWFFGDPEALKKAFARLPATLGDKAMYRQPDEIRGGTAERLESELQKAGYFRGGMSKVAVAKDVAQFMVLDVNRSPSFQCFVSGMRRLLGEDTPTGD